MLKSMGERTPPCGTPDLNCRFVDVWFLNVGSAVFVECLVLNPCCVVMFGMFCVM